MFTKSDIQRMMLSSVGALAVSAVCVLGAVGPAKAAAPNAPLTVADWQDKVQDRIAQQQESLAVYQPRALTKAAVAIHFTQDGDFAGATLAQSSGNARVDSRAIRVANHIAYPALPQDMRGAARTVTMNLYFGNAGAAAEYAALQTPAKTMQVADADRGNQIQIAAR